MVAMAPPRSTVSVMPMTLYRTGRHFYASCLDRLGPDASPHRGMDAAGRWFCAIGPDWRAGWGDCVDRARVGGGERARGGRDAAGHGGSAQPWVSARVRRPDQLGGRRRRFLELARGDVSRGRQHDPGPIPAGFCLAVQGAFERRLYRAGGIPLFAAFAGWRALHAGNGDGGCAGGRCGAGRHALDHAGRDLRNRRVRGRGAGRRANTVRHQCGGSAADGHGSAWPRCGRPRGGVGAA